MGKRQAGATTSDLSTDGLRQLAERVVAMAKLAPEDPYCGLLDPAERAASFPDLDTYDDARPDADVLEAMALAAESARKLSERNLQSVQESLAAVEKRVRAGDASKLDANIARAELAEQRRLENDAKTQLEKLGRYLNLDGYALSFGDVEGFFSQTLN